GVQTCALPIWLARNDDARERDQEGRTCSGDALMAHQHPQRNETVQDRLTITTAPSCRCSARLAHEKSIHVGQKRQSPFIENQEGLMNTQICARIVAVGIIACALGIPLIAQPPAPAATSQAARPAPLRSPDIHPDRTVTFRLLAPKATEVTVNGSWDNGTNIKMSKDDAGVWSATVGPVAPQLWGYWFMVDGVKALDPNNAETQRDGSRYDN